MEKDTFTFLNPGRLVDKELELVLIEKIPSNLRKKYVPMYKFEMINIKTEEKMGEIRLRIGDNENLICAGHIGYSVDKKYRGQKLASRSCKLLFSLAKKHNMNQLWITSDPDNIASRKTCEFAGGVLVEIVNIPKWHEMYKDGSKKVCRYKFDI